MAERKELSTKNKLLLAGGALTVAAGGIVVGSGYISQREGQKQGDSSKKQTAEATATPYDQLLRPITPTEAAVIAAATREPSPTAKPPEATVTSTPTTAPTKEAIPTRVVEKSPLPSYSVYFGNITDPKTGAKLAEMVMASIPQAGGNDEVFVYWISSKDQMGGRSRQGMQLKPLNTNATHFELGWMPPGGKPTDLQRYFTGDYNPQAKIISGDTTRPYLNGKHTLKYVGEGKAVVFRTMEQIITDQSSDQPINVQQDLAKFNIRVGLWP